MTDHPNYKYRPRRRKHTKPRTGPQANLANNSAGNTKSSASNSANNNTSNKNTSASNSSNSGVQLMANSTPSSISSSTHNQSSSSDVQYERMSPYNYNNMYYNDGSSLASPGNSTPSPSPPNSRSNKKMNFKIEGGVSTTPEMSPIDSSTKIDFEQALPSTTTTFNSSVTSSAASKSRYGFDNSFDANTTKNDYHYGSNDRMYDEQSAMSSHAETNKKSNFGSSHAPPSAASQATTIAAMGNGMYVMCSNRGILDQGHIVTGTYFPPLPTSQDHQNLGSANLLSTSSHNHHIHHQQQQQQHHHHHHQHQNQQAHHHYSSNTQAAQNLIQNGNGGGDGKYSKSNDSNNNKHGSENSNSNEMNNCANSNGSSSSSSSKNESKKSFKKSSKDDEIADDKLIKNDSNNNSNNQDNKNNSNKIDMNNRLVMSSPTMSALSPYHHQSPYLSQYKNHINYSDQSAAQQQQQQQQHHDDINGVDPSQQSNLNKYNNFVPDYDPYQNNAIYYHSPSHFAHSHGLQPPPTSGAGQATAFYVTNPDYYHQSYTMAPTAPATLVQPMVAKIDAVIGATSIPLHPSQGLLGETYVTAEQLKEDDFSNILAGVRKTCYSN